jgi:hypothetical protein
MNALSVKNIYTIIYIVLAGLFILGIGYFYTTFSGNPIAKLVAKNNIQRYVEYKYPQNYSIGKVRYNFVTENYIVAVLDDNKKSYTDIKYHNNGMLNEHKKLLSDEKEADILENKLDNEIGVLLKTINFEFDNINCDSTVCINANQKFKSAKDFERFDLATVMVNNKNEIDKDRFADMAYAVIPEVKANMYFKEGSEINICYQYGKQDKNYSIEFSYENSDIRLTREFIAKNAVVKGN